MSLQEFINLWTQQDVSFPNCENNQCMTLVHRYVSEVLGLEDPAILSQPLAHLVYDNFTSVVGHENFEKIANTPTNVPSPGDIMVFKSDPGDAAGHISVYVSGDVNSFQSFDADFPWGTKPHLQNHDYNLVLGWLTPLVVSVEKSTQIIQDQLKTQIDATTQCQSQLKSASDHASTLQISLDALQKKYDELSTENTNLQVNISQVQKRNGELLDQMSAMEKADSTAVDKGTRLQTLVTDLQDYIHAIADSVKVQYEIATIKDTVEAILGAIAALKKPIETPPPDTQPLDTIPTIANNVNILMVLYNAIKKFIWVSKVPRN